MKSNVSFSFENSMEIMNSNQMENYYSHPDVAFIIACQSKELISPCFEGLLFMLESLKRFLNRTKLLCRRLI
jgi:hypothetical protein